MAKNFVPELIKFIETFDKMEFKTDRAMSELTSFKIGGPADIVISPPSLQSFCAVLDYVSERGVKHTVLGKGSNVLFADAGYRGAVITTGNLSGLTVDEESKIIVAECGVSLTYCASAAKKASVAGMEFTYGIPGSCGGAVYMNAGAYGGEMADIVVASTYYDTVTRSVATMERENHAFGYRTSAFKTHPSRVILSSAFQLTAGDRDAITQKMDGFMEQRISKQPLEYPSAGSVFKRFPGYYTAQMIDESGLKGKSVGGAQVSEKHAGFIVNKGNATAADVLALIDVIREAVMTKFGVEIECEIIYID